MANACQVIVRGNNTEQFKTKLVLGLMSHNLTNFSGWVHGQIFDSQTRVSPLQGDSETDIAECRDTLRKAARETLTEWKQRAKAKTFDLDGTLEEIMSMIDSSDKTQVASIKTLDDATTQKEEQILDTNKLDDHLEDFYGVGSFGVSSALKRTFRNNIVGVAYYDLNSGKLKAGTDIELNKDIWRFKAKIFKTMVEYMKANLSGSDIEELTSNLFEGQNDPDKVNPIIHKFDAVNYNKAMSLFFSKVASSDSFTDDIQRAFTSRAGNSESLNKTLEYRSLFQALNTIESFQQQVSSKYKGAHLRDISLKLYDSGRLSEGFSLVDKYMSDPANAADLEALANSKENPFDAKAVLAGIKQETGLTVLDAAQSYTMLQHFDALLKTTAGDQINIKKSLMNYNGVYISDKYSYNRHTLSGQKVGWQQSEEYGSEVFTSDFTRAIIESIPIYDIDSGLYLNRNMDCTSLIMAFSSLRQAVLTDDSLFKDVSNKGVRVNNLVEQLKQEMRSLYDDPVKSVQKILELMFDSTEGSGLDYGLVEVMSRVKGVNTASLSVLKSLYDYVFNKNNKKSFYAQNLVGSTSYNNTLSKLLYEIAGYAVRNNMVNYLETTYDKTLKRQKSNMRRKWFTEQDRAHLETSINQHVNYGMSPQYVAALAANPNAVDSSGNKVDELSDYFSSHSNLHRPAMVRNSPVVLDNETSRTNSEVTSYSTTFGSYTVWLVVPNKIRAKIFGGDSTTTSSYARFEATPGFFEALNKVDLLEFRSKLVLAQHQGKALDANLVSSEDKLMFDVLSFLDSTLGMNFLIDPDTNIQILQIYKQNYEPRGTARGMKHFMAPFLRLGFRASYAASLHFKASQEGKSLLEYMRKNVPSLVNTTRTAYSGIHVALGEVSFDIASFKDWVLEDWANAMALFRGDSLSPTTTDNSGLYRANCTVMNQGNNMAYRLYKSATNPDGSESNVAQLMFVQNPDMIRNTYYDLDAVGKDGEAKSIREFSLGELYHHGIIDRFYNHYTDHGTIIVQPTAYSDKPTFISYEIDPTSWGGERRINLMTASEDTILGIFKDTIGNMYVKVRNSTETKMKTIADQYRKINGISNEADWHDILHMMTERDLTKLAQSMGLEVEQYKDYRIVKDSDKTEHVVMNEMLRYNASLFSDTTRLKKVLTEQKMQFVTQLNDSNVIFQVLQYGDKLDDYTKKDVSRQPNMSPMLATILDLFAKDTSLNGWKKRAAFMRDWVDAKTGRLILAKQGGKNIISLSDNIDMSDTENFVLNPLLNKYFMVESLVGNNMRLSQTASEINHPFGKQHPFYEARKIKSATDWNGLQYEKLNDNEFNAVQATLASVDNVDALQRLVDSASFSRYTTKVKAAINQVLDASYKYVTGTTQVTQTKRNVPITGTVQYVLQGHREGVPPRIKCAVIYDVEAEVFNHRGEDDKVDSCDGSGKITPFEAIMENRALGSQAVGIVRKPLWDSYSQDSCTSTLFKFAVDTITNESMRNTMKSRVSHYRLFKKMTNLQWSADDRIDLTKPMASDIEWANDENGTVQQNSWFRNTILGGENLFYKDKYDHVWQITGFNKSVSDSTGAAIYYTEEREVGVNNSDGTPHIVKRWHLFYDEAVRDGQSKHITADSSIDAFRMMSVLNAQGKKAHTINSLYELHSALGGVRSCDVKGNFNEYNNEVVVNFMSNIGRKKAGVRKDAFVNQNNYDQFLKKYHIGYAVNKSACKNGAKNINPAESWADDSDLTWFEMDASGLGMQLNAEHDIIDSELTEFSQVISACAAYGWTFDNCYEIFEGLGRAVFQGSERLMNGLRQYLDSLTDESRDSARMSLYDTIGRIMFFNMRIKDDASLTKIIIDGVQREFNKYSDHHNDNMQFPFSDKNMFDKFLSTLASTITKDSIKRKHKGVGAVMVSAFDMMQYFEIPDRSGKVEKLMAPSVVKRARNAYREELLVYLKELNSYNAETDSIYGRDHISDLDLDDLEKLALHFDKTGGFSEYYTADEDPVAAEEHWSNVWLSKIEAPRYDDASFFTPEDIVEVIDTSDSEHVKVIETVQLSSLKKYYEFKDKYKTVPQNIKFRASVTSPHNLRPSMIRWQYRDGNGVHYMNIFDTPAIRNAYDAGTVRDESYVQQVQNTLQNVEDGFFYDNEGTRHEILSGTLENEAAELIMSDIYQDLFGTSGYSFDEVMTQGEEFFRKKNANIYPPNTSAYDAAFLSSDGKHTLITFGEVVPDGKTIVQRRTGKLMTNRDGSIILMDDGREVVQVGQWCNVQGVFYDKDTDKFYKGTSVKDADKVELDKVDYRVSNGKVQKRFRLVSKYSYLHQHEIAKSGKFTQDTYDLYKIADMKDFVEVFGDEKIAEKKRAEILSKLYHAQDYKMIQLNPSYTSRPRLTLAQSAFQDILNDDSLDPDMLQLLDTQFKTIGPSSEKEAFARFTAMKNKFLDKEAHKEWVSFQDSTKFISSRIPAQTLQSFMSMKLVGWVGGINNVAYVSHFQTYLQGSDYDIDKAYIMGQNYDKSSHYVKWSPYFDYSDIQTLELSKTLPVPKNITAVMVNNNTGVDLTAEIDAMIENSYWDEDKGRLTLQRVNASQKKDFLKVFSQALRKLERYHGRYQYRKHITGNPEERQRKLDRLQAVQNTFNAHEKYEPPMALANEAFKNVASANIYAVANDIRNRDQATIAVSLKSLRPVAENSPKGQLEVTRNMLNPFTKYIIQYDNLLGKNVVGIMANGEKFWFNTSYHWFNTLINGSDEDCMRLRFSIKLNRIEGRSKGTRFDPQCQTRTVTHLPDLARDARVRERLKTLFNATDESLEYRHVDQIISQLVSAATDNAKELILAKLNADSNFSKMFLFLIVMGYKVDDVAAFMTSPAGEMISGLAPKNMFQFGDGRNSANTAIRLAQGLVYSNRFLRSRYTSQNTVYLDDEGGGDEEGGTIVNETKKTTATKKLRDIIKLDDPNHKYYAFGKQVEERLKQAGYVIDNIREIPLDNLMQQFILAAVEDETIDLREVYGDTSDAEIGNWLLYCQDLVNRLRSYSAQYKNGYSELNKDIEEFSKIYDYASEMSDITTSYLALNQGLPTDVTSLYDRLRKMREVVKTRERILGINGTALFSGDEKTQMEKIMDVVPKISENNPEFLYYNPNPGTAEEAKRSQETVNKIEKALRTAFDAGVMNNVDIVKVLTDPEYRKALADYLYYIKGTTNVMDLLYGISHYAATMDALGAHVVSVNEFSMQGRMISKWTEKAQYSLDEKVIKRDLRFGEQAIMLDFLRSLPPLVFSQTVHGLTRRMDPTTTTAFNLSSEEGFVGFLRFFKTEYMDFLRENYPNNSLVKHLTKINDNGVSSIGLDIDLRHADQSTATTLAFREILQGVSEFENERPSFHPGYTVADILELFNLMMNCNNYGRERLTTAFQEHRNKKGILFRYYKWVGEHDISRSEYVPQYVETDREMAEAPLINEWEEPYHNEKFVKVRDRIWGYVLKSKGKGEKFYSTYAVSAALKNNADTPEIRNQRRRIYMENMPLLMPGLFKRQSIINILGDSDTFSNQDMTDLKALIRDLTLSAKITLPIDCS